MLIDVLGMAIISIFLFSAIVLFKIVPATFKIRLFASAGAFFTAFTYAFLYLYLKSSNDLYIALFLGAFCMEALSGVICGRELMKAIEVQKKAKQEVAISMDERHLLKDSIISNRIYVALTNSFIDVISPILSKKVIENVLDDVISQMPQVFNKCKILENKRIDFSPVISNLNSIPEEKRFTVLTRGFNLFIRNLMKTSETATSTAVSNKAFETVFKNIMKGYLDIFFRYGIPLQMPPGMLEKEKAKSAAYILLKDTFEPLLKECSKNTIVYLRNGLEKMGKTQEIYNCILMKSQRKVNLSEIYKWIDKTPPEKAIKSIINAFDVLLKISSPKFRFDIKRKDAHNIFLTLFSRSLERFGSSVQKYGILDTIPEDIETLFPFRLKAGTSYLLKEDRPVKGYSLLKGGMSYGAHGLCVSKYPPEIINKRYDPIHPSILWLTFKENGLSPKKLDILKKRVSTFEKIYPESIVLLDCFDQIVYANGFALAFSLLKYLKENSRVKNTNLILSINPDSLDKKQLAEIEKELEGVEV